MTPANWPPPTDHVPGDLFADLLTGWVGPVEYLHKYGDDDYRWEPAVWPCIDKGTASRVRLPLTRPEAAWHLARTLAAGERCPTCKGSRMAPITVDPAYPCADCSGTGYLRPPAPAWHCLPVALGGALHFTAAQHSAALLACSAWRVKAGLGPVRGPLGAWALYDYGMAPRKVWQRAVPGVGDAVVSVWEDCVYHHGWTFDPSCSANRLHGDEIGAPGRACADAAALAAGFACIDDDGSLTLPWPTEMPR